MLRIRHWSTSRCTSRRTRRRTAATRSGRATRAPPARCSTGISTSVEQHPLGPRGHRPDARRLDFTGTTLWKLTTESLAWTLDNSTANHAREHGRRHWGGLDFHPPARADGVVVEMLRSDRVYASSGTVNGTRGSFVALVFNDPDRQYLGEAQPVAAHVSTPLPETSVGRAIWPLTSVTTSLSDLITISPLVFAYLAERESIMARHGPFYRTSRSSALPSFPRSWHFINSIPMIPIDPLYYAWHKSPL